MVDVDIHDRRHAAHGLDHDGMQTLNTERKANNRASIVVRDGVIGPCTTILLTVIVAA